MEVKNIGGAATAAWGGWGATEGVPENWVSKLVPGGTRPQPLLQFLDG